MQMKTQDKKLDFCKPVGQSFQTIKLYKQVDVLLSII